MSRAGESDRLFVAADLPANTVAAIAAWQVEHLAARPDLRLNHALHLTLAFLGDVPRGRVGDVVAALEGVRFAAVPLAAGGVLFLPARGRKRVLTLALADSGGGLARLQAEVAAALAPTGLYAPEPRPWLPHVTLAIPAAQVTRFPCKTSPFRGFVPSGSSCIVASWSAPERCTLP